MNLTKHNMVSLTLMSFVFLAGINASDSKGTRASAGSLKDQSLTAKILGQLSQTKAVYLLEKYIQAPIKKPLQRLMEYGNEPASQQYQDLGKEAQTALNIPLERQVPIKRLNPKSLIATILKPGALAEPDAIFVNEERLNSRAYGARRSALFHKAIHKKYNDGASSDLFSNITFLGAALTTHLVIKAIKPQGRFKIPHILGVIIAGETANILTELKYARFMERRADIEGHYATACADCVKESSEHRRTLFAEGNNPILTQNSGYLTAEELDIIAHDLKQSHQLCLYHQKQSAEK